jgi:Rhodopirellula transposase.
LPRISYPEEIEQRIRAFFETLNEKDRRGYAGIEAIKLGHGGQKYISSVLGCHPQTVMAGIYEITNGTDVPEERIRKPGGGRKKIIETEENIDEVFLEILKHHTAGSPTDDKIKWTNLCPKGISKAFESKGMNITPYVVKQLLKKHGFVERKMQKTVTMKDCKDRNEQFERIHELINEYSKSKNPIISMDVKKRIHRQFLP